MYMYVMQNPEEQDLWSIKRKHIHVSDFSLYLDLADHGQRRYVLQRILQEAGTYKQKIKEWRCSCLKKEKRGPANVVGNLAIFKKSFRLTLKVKKRKSRMRSQRNTMSVVTAILAITKWKHHALCEPKMPASLRNTSKPLREKWKFWHRSWPSGDEDQIRSLIKSRNTRLYQLQDDLVQRTWKWRTFS